MSQHIVDLTGDSDSDASPDIKQRHNRQVILDDEHDEHGNSVQLVPDGALRERSNQAPRIVRPQSQETLWSSEFAPHPSKVIQNMRPVSQPHQKQASAGNPRPALGSSSTIRPPSAAHQQSRPFSTPSKENRYGYGYGSQPGRPDSDGTPFARSYRNDQGTSSSYGRNGGNPNFNPNQFPYNYVPSPQRPPVIVSKSSLDRNGRSTSRPAESRNIFSSHSTFSNPYSIEPIDYDAQMERILRQSAPTRDAQRSGPPRFQPEIEVPERNLLELLESIPDDDETIPYHVQPKDVNVTLLRHQLKGVAWMKEREEGINKGGILADDMGLGKTVQTISLIVSNPSKDPACKSTLVVAPLALIRQWESEIKSKTTDGLLSVLVYHGSERISNIETLKTYDVVITTYNVLTGEFQPPAKDERDLDSEFIKPGKDSGPLFKVTWYRVILDEAQTIKNKSTKGAQACCALYSNYRFCLTGTPIQNNLDELYSLFRFLRVKPYCDYATYKREVSDPFKQSRPKTAIKRLQIILKAVMIRRTKFSKLEGKPLLNLPQRKVELKTIPFSLQERRFYDSLEDRMRRKLDAYMQEGSMGTNYTNVLCLLLRLRQACNHPKLVGGQESAESDIGSTKDDNEEIDDLAAMLGSLDVNVRQCRICQEPLPAGKPKGECDTCSASVLAKQPTQEQLVTSTKIEAMLDILKNTAKTHPGEKTIIFSQFTSMLDLIENALKENGFKYCRYDGQMNNQKREDSLRRIRERPEYTVMLISLKCGSLGLNLTVANRVLMMDIWWNPALEDQAIDRVHRIGQTRDVLVTRLTIVSTVEDRILKLQEKKRELIEGALGDSIGNIKKNKKLSVQELMMLINGGE